MTQVKWMQINSIKLFYNMFQIVGRIKACLWYFTSIMNPSVHLLSCLMGLIPKKISTKVLENLMKIISREYSNHSGGRIYMGGESASSNRYKKGLSGKHNINSVYHHYGA